MSSLDLRTEILDFIASDLPTETIIDLTNDFLPLKQILDLAGVSGNDPWLGIDFIGSDEIPVSSPANNSTGQYRENGAIYLHIVERSKLNVHNDILARAETIRNKFRGQRIGNTIIESVSPPNTSTGATLNFEGGYSSASVILTYERDRNL